MGRIKEYYHDEICKGLCDSELIMKSEYYFDFSVRWIETLLTVKQEFAAANNLSLDNSIDVAKLKMMWDRNR